MREARPSRPRPAKIDTRVTTSGSGSFGMGIWGASASMSATVGYVKSDEQFSREDIALRAGLRSSVDVAFHTEPISLERMASKSTIENIKSGAMVPETEKDPESADGRRAQDEEAGVRRHPPPPDGARSGSDEQRKLREKKDFGPTGSPRRSPTGAGEPQPPDGRRWRRRDRDGL